MARAAEQRGRHLNWAARPASAAEAEDRCSASGSVEAEAPPQPAAAAHCRRALEWEPAGLVRVRLDPPSDVSLELPWARTELGPCQLLESGRGGR